MRPGCPARRSGARLLAAIAEQTAAGSRIRGRNRGSATPTSNHTKHKKTCWAEFLFFGKCDLTNRKL